jgi:hypothetical protein
MNNPQQSTESDDQNVETIQRPDEVEEQLAKSENDQQAESGETPDENSPNEADDM